MLESVIALSVLGLVLVGLRLLQAQFEFLLGTGMSLVVFGLALGVPTGLYYHLLLRRFLLRKSQLPDYWWVFPSRVHPLLSEEDEQKLRLWFRLGGAGFLICLSGCFIFFWALLK